MPSRLIARSAISLAAAAAAVDKINGVPLDLIGLDVQPAVVFLAVAALIRIWFDSTIDGNSCAISCGCGLGKLGKVEKVNEGEDLNWVPLVVLYSGS